MQDQANLSTIENRIYRSTFQDGLIDIFSGLGVLSYGLGLRYGNYIGFILPALFPMFWSVLRNRFTQPRAGYVKFSEERLTKEKTKFQMAIFTGTAFIITGIGIFLLYSASADAMQRLGGHPFGAVLAIAFIGTGIAMQLYRFLGYGVLLLLAVTIGFVWNFDVRYYLPIIGGVISLVGFAMLCVFLRKHSLNKMGQPHEYQ